MKFLHNIITTFLFSTIIISCTAQTKTTLTADEFEKEITTKGNIQILDVRTPKEFFSGHIKNALQADWNDKTEFERHRQGSTHTQVCSYQQMPGGVQIQFCHSSRLATHFLYGH